MPAETTIHWHGVRLPNAGPPIERLPAGPADTTITFDEKFVGGHPLFTINGHAAPDVPPVAAADGLHR